MNSESSRLFLIGKLGALEMLSDGFDSVYLSIRGDLLTDVRVTDRKKQLHQIALENLKTLRRAKTKIQSRLDALRNKVCQYVSGSTTDSGSASLIARYSTTGDELAICT
jgi:chaperonin cofactor prefoldin